MTLPVCLADQVQALVEEAIATAPPTPMALADLTDVTASGAACQVLTSDGAGGQSWQPSPTVVSATNPTGAPTGCQNLWINTTEGTIQANINGIWTQIINTTTDDYERVDFESITNVTAVSDSGLEIMRNAAVVEAIAMTAGVAPTGPETFRVYAHNTAAGPATLIGSGTLAANSRTTGIITITPYLLAAGAHLSATIETVNGSRRATVTAFYNDLD